MVVRVRKRLKVPVVVDEMIDEDDMNVPVELKFHPHVCNNCHRRSTGTRDRYGRIDGQSVRLGVAWVDGRFVSASLCNYEVCCRSTCCRGLRLVQFTFVTLLLFCELPLKLETNYTGFQFLRSRTLPKPV